MAFVNAYKPQQSTPLTEEESLGPDPYDLNFVFPVHLESLETERVKLVSFVARTFGPLHWQETQKHPDIYQYYPFVFPAYAPFIEYIEVGVRRSPENVLFAIIDKTRPDAAHPEFGGSFAGIIGLYHSSATNLSTEIAFVVILPAFQRTHVATNAVGVLMRYCLEPRTARPPGLGLRRVQWCAHSKNLASAGLAERMGFKREGVLRWHWAVSPELNVHGMKPGEQDPIPERYGRNTVLLSVCWDDWVGGVREQVHKHIDREV